MDCQLHKTHQPRALTIEQHHVVPRHWQALYTPSVPPYPGTFSEFGTVQELWDARIVPLAPTCHRNVHTVLVQIMRSLAGRTLDEAVHAARLALRPQLSTAVMAAQAVIRFQAAGGDPLMLVKAGAWGEA